MAYYYIKNNLTFKSKTRLYFFEWTQGGGHVTFGFHGTLKEWKGRLATDLKDAKVKLITKRKLETIEELKKAGII